MKKSFLFLALFFNCLFTLYGQTPQIKSTVGGKFYIEFPKGIRTPSIYDLVCYEDDNGDRIDNVFSPEGYALVHTDLGWNVIDSLGNYLFDRFCYGFPFIYEGSYFRCSADKKSNKSFLFSTNGSLIDEVNNFYKFTEENATFYIERSYYKELEHTYIGVKYCKRGENGNWKTIWSDLSLNPVYEIDGLYDLTPHGVCNYARKYDNPEDMRALKPFTLLREYAHDGTMVASYSGRCRALDWQYFLNKKELKKLKSLFGAIPPSIVIVEEVPNSQKGDLFFMGEKILCGVTYLLDGVQAPCGNYQKTNQMMAKLWKKELRHTILNPINISKFQDIFLKPGIKLLQRNDSVIKTSVKQSVKGRRIEPAFNNGKYCFMIEGKPLHYNNTKYDTIEPLSQNLYVGKSGEKIDILADKGEVLISESSYVTPFNVDIEGIQLYVAVDSLMKKRLFTETGVVISAPYDDILPVVTSNCTGVYYCNDNKWNYSPLTKSINNQPIYDYISDFDSLGLARVYINGNEGKINLQGEVVRGVSSTLLFFGSSKDIPLAQRMQYLQEAYNLATLAMETQNMGKIMNELGLIYEEINDYTKAMECYQIAANHDCKDANVNYYRLKNAGQKEMLENFSEALNNLTQIIAGKTIQSTGNSFNLGNNHPMSSFSNGGSSYEAQYRNWERRARAHYESLTNLGVRYKKNEKNTSGSTGQGMSSNNYVSMKKSLREAQNEMAKIRREAQSKGITISKSEYESVTVNY